jgi:ribonuclease J
MDKMVTCDFIHRNQNHLVMDLDFYQFTQLIDIRPDADGHFIHSMSEPFSDEDLEDKIMHNWLDHFKIQFHQLHASGHMNKEELASLIQHVNPRRIFPIHTENQNLFNTRFGNVQTIKLSREYSL